MERKFGYKKRMLKNVIHDIDHLDFKEETLNRVKKDITNLESKIDQHSQSEASA